MIKNIIFDWSGVIKDDTDILLITINLVFKKYGLDPISAEELKREWDMPFMKFYNKYIPSLTLEQGKQDYLVAYSQSRLEVTPKPFPGIVEALKFFKDLNLNIYILSSDPTEYLLKEVVDYGLGDIFKEIYSWEHDKTARLQEILNRGGLKKEEAIFIGDTTHEIECSRAVGIKSMAVTWGTFDEARLKAANPDFLVHTVEELKEAILK